VNAADVRAAGAAALATVLGAFALTPVFSSLASSSPRQIKNISSENQALLKDSP